MANVTTKFDFRPARMAHREPLLRLMRALDTEDPTGTPFDVAGRNAALGRFLRNASSGRAWLIRAGEEIVGYVVLTFSFSFEFGGRDAFIDELYVEPEYRRQGLGTRALRIAEKSCAALDVKALHLEVTRKNNAALNLYRHEGFRDHDRYLMTKWIARRRV